MEARQLGAYLARARVGIGLASVLMPGTALSVGFGRDAHTPGGRAVVRLMGARDAALGAGGSIAVGQGAGGGDWLSMAALVDGFDGLVLLATPGLPRRSRVIGLAALGSAAYHLILSKQIAAEEHADGASSA